MIANVYTIYDTKAKAYLQPWFASNNEVALRNIQRSLQDRDNAFARFPHDFILFHIGEFDDASGSIKSVKPFSLGVVSEFIEASSPASADTAAA